MNFMNKTFLLIIEKILDKLMMEAYNSYFYSFFILFFESIIGL